MVPVLDDRGNQLRRDGKLVWRNTKADVELEDYCQDFGFWFQRPDNSEREWMPVWKYMELYERIASRNGGICAFELNESQIYLYKVMCEMKREGRPVRINDGKARQMGGSTFVAGFFYPLVAFVPGKSCGIVADISAHASGLYKKYTLLYETTPEFLKRHLKKEAKNAYELTFDYGRGVKSTIKVLVQGEGAGRSEHFNYLHKSEVAFWKDILATCLALDNTVSDNDTESVIFNETTANGINDWKTMYDKGFIKGNPYRSIFIPWFLESSYRMKYDGHPLTPNEIALQKEHGLELDQLQWWLNKWHSTNNDTEKMAQEFPSNPLEMFVTSGSSVFNSKLVQKRKAELLESEPKRRGFYGYKLKYAEDGTPIITDIRWYDDPKGSVSVFEEPKAGHPYVMVNDPAQGGADYWATQLVDNSNCRQVATFHKSGCDADEATFQSYCLYKEYADACGRVMVAGETNTTSYFVNTFRKLGVRDMYVNHDTESAFGGRYLENLGYKTKQSNRKRMIDDFVIAFRDDPSIITDYETICEMETFQYVSVGAEGKAKAMASGSSAHDDLVMSMCGFYLIRYEYPSNVERVSEARADVPFDPLRPRKTVKPNRGYMRW